MIRSAGLRPYDWMDLPIPRSCHHCLPPNGSAGWLEIPMVIILSHLSNLRLPIAPWERRRQPYGPAQRQHRPDQRFLGGQAPGVSGETLHAIASGVRRAGCRLNRHTLGRSSSGFFPHTVMPPSPASTAKARRFPADVGCCRDHHAGLVLRRRLLLLPALARGPRARDLRAGHGQPRLPADVPQIRRLRLTALLG